VLEHAARDPAAGLYPAADRHPAAGRLDPAERELEKPAAALVDRESFELAAGVLLLTCHLGIFSDGSYES
jgi:hypothetical protein